MDKTNNKEQKLTELERKAILVKAAKLMKKNPKFQQHLEEKYGKKSTKKLSEE